MYVFAFFNWLAKKQPKHYDPYKNGDFQTGAGAGADAGAGGDRTSGAAVASTDDDGNDNPVTICDHAARNPFMLYSMEMRPTLQAAKPGITVGELSKMLGTIHNHQ